MTLLTLTMTAQGEDDAIQICESLRPHLGSAAALTRLLSSAKVRVTGIESTASRGRLRAQLCTMADLGLPRVRSVLSDYLLTYCYSIHVPFTPHKEGTNSGRYLPPAGGASA